MVTCMNYSLNMLLNFVKEYLSACGEYGRVALESLGMPADNQTAMSDYRQRCGKYREILRCTYRALLNACDMVGVYKERLIPLYKAVRRHGSRQKQQGKEWYLCYVGKLDLVYRTKRYLAVDPPSPAFSAGDTRNLKGSGEK